jgi:hypothetical protein
LSAARFTARNRIKYPIAGIDDEVRELLERPYRIVYRVTDSAVEVLTVKRYRQRPA